MIEHVIHVDIIIAQNLGKRAGLTPSDMFFIITVYITDRLKKQAPRITL